MEISKYDKGFVDTDNGPIRVIELGEDMSVYSLEKAAKNGVVIVYDYKYGDWSGDGVALVKGKNGLWAYESLSHCSCYGPLDRVIEESSFDKTLDECFSNITDESEKRPEIYEAAKHFI